MANTVNMILDHAQQSVGGAKPQPGAGYQTPPPPMAQNAVTPPAPGMAGPPPGAKYPVPPGSPAPPPAIGAMPPAPPTGRLGSGTQFGGVGTVGAQAGPADYQGVQGFADQAYSQARRNIDPAQAQASRRMEQDLINKGIDPSSEQGMAMLDQQNRNFADQDNSANFAALQFGQGIQNQMFNQGMANTQQAGNMQQALWQAQNQRYSTDAQKYGIDVGANTARNAQEVQRYGIDQNTGIAQGQLNLATQGQDFNQMMGLEGVDFRNRAYNDKQDQYYDQLTMAMMGIPIPGYGGYDPSGLASDQMATSGGGGIFG